MPHSAIPAPPSLYPEIREMPTPPGKGEHGYYRRGDNGWIVTAPVWPSFREDMEFKGNVYLSRYGRFVNDVGPKQRDTRGQLFSVTEEPWRLIFQHGGAKEFPVSQIVAHRWHIRPPYQDIVFPQLEGVTIYDFQCPECERGIFSSTDEEQAAFMLRQHLTSRVNDQHVYQPKDIKELGDELGVDLSRSRTMRKVQRTVHGPQVGVVQEKPVDTAATPDVERSQGYACTACGWAPLKTSKNPGSSLRFHLLHCKGKPPRADEDESENPA